MFIGELIGMFIGMFIGTALFWSSYSRNKETDKHEKQKIEKLEEWEKEIRRKFGYTAKAFSKEFIEPLKKGETVFWYSALNIIPEWIVDTALEHYNLRINYKYDGGNWWTLYVEENN